MKTTKLYEEQANTARKSFRRIVLMTIALVAIASPAAEGEQAAGGKEHSSERLRSPYAGQSHAAQTGLLSNEVEALSAGAGMAMALPAELNGYPGPRHLLDAADAGELSLSARQRQTVQNLYDRMLSEAKAKGQEIIKAESQLAHQFADRSIDEIALRNVLAQIAHLRAELRFIHLRTHLKTRELLNSEQIDRYSTLRGYEADHSQSRAHGSHGGNAME